MPQLAQADLFLSQVFWLVTVFALTYFFIARYFIPRISKVVDKRNEGVKKNIADAESLLAKQKALKTEMEELLAKARQEGTAVRNMASEKAEDFLQDQVRGFEKNLNKKISQEEERLLRLKQRLAKDVEASSDLLAKEIVKVIFPTNFKVRV